VDITCIASEGIDAGKKAAISVRPEKINISKSSLTGQNSFKAKVIETAYIGSDTRFILLAGSFRLSVWEQNKSSRLDSDKFYCQGEEVWVNFPQENTLVLPG
jgi:spermidine/putrescine transport system ATP-binding protein